MSRSRLLAISAAALIAAFAFGAVAHAQSDPVKCQRGVLKAVSKFFKAKTKALGKCEDGKTKGTHTDPCPFPTPFPTPLPMGGSPGRKATDAIAKASLKLRATIDKRCGGSDHVCGTGDDNLNIPLLFGQGGDLLTVCPNFENGACDNAINHCGDLATCLECISEAAIDQWITFLYSHFDASKFGAVDVAGAQANKCQVGIGKEVAKYGLLKEKALKKCWDKRLQGVHSDACPNPMASPGMVSRAAADAIAKAEGKKITKICRACGGDNLCDNTVDVVNPGTPTIAGTNNGSDIPLADIFTAPVLCPDLIVPPAPSRSPLPCARSLTTLADLVFCEDCVAEFKVDCVDATRVVRIPPAAVPSECNPAPTPMPTPALPVCGPSSFPPAGDDVFDSLAVVAVRIPLPAGTFPAPTPTPVTLILRGPAVIHRLAPVDPGDGHREIATTFGPISLKGSSGIGPVTLTESKDPMRVSGGTIKAQTSNAPLVDFPADSFFDIFFVLHTALPPPLDQIHNDDPIRMRQVIRCTPPYGSIYVPAYTIEIPLFDKQDNFVASLTHAQHRVSSPLCGNGIVEPPGEECDDGNLTDGDGCEAGCTLPFCGNGIVDGSEACDDGNPTSNDGCEPDCTLTPPPACSSFPPAGNDSFDSLAVVSMAIPALSVDDSIFLRGPTTIHRDGPFDAGDGRRQIATEMTAMSLTGSTAILGHVKIIESPSLASTGQIKAQTISGDFPADSFFDLFFEIDTQFPPPYDKLHNAVPIHLQQVIKCVPPLGSIYVPAYALSTPLLDVTNTPVGTLTHAQHRVPAGPLCGNGVVNPGESCDDGNRLDCDGCDSNCTTGCGNGIACAPEECDDGNAIPGDGCESNCTVTVPPCSGETCGNFTGTCNPSFPGECFCFTVAEGGGNCADDFQCSTAQSCPGGTSTCPPGTTCYVSTCCGGPTCGPNTCTGVLRGVGGGGPTAAGN
jgi:cysteine-rich repeat protein